MGTEYMQTIMKEEMSRGKLYKYQQDAKKITEGGGVVGPIRSCHCDPKVKVPVLY